MIAEGYGDRRTLERRVQGMENGWRIRSCSKPMRMRNMPRLSTSIWRISKSRSSAHRTIRTTLVLLSDVQGEKIDEVFIGSCMTNIGHFRAAGKLLDNHKGQLPTRLWVAPPTRMAAGSADRRRYYSVFGKSGARIEIPGCSLCMGQPGARSRRCDGGFHLNP
nr:bifunctional aconitate hydratase 2/2-methylisocitrate dehydratase [Raoultella sp. NCTC 9187]